MTYQGAHTVDLPSVVELTTNDTFYVYLHITDGGDHPQGVDYADAELDASNSTASDVGLRAYTPNRSGLDISPW